MYENLEYHKVILNNNKGFSNGIIKNQVTLPHSIIYSHISDIYYDIKYITNVSTAVSHLVISLIIQASCLVNWWRVALHVVLVGL